MICTTTVATPMLLGRQELCDLPSAYRPDGAHIRVALAMRQQHKRRRHDDNQGDCAKWPVRPSSVTYVERGPKRMMAAPTRTTAAPAMSHQSGRAPSRNQSQAI